MIRSVTTLAAFVFASGASPPSTASRLYGLSAGSVSSFNSSPGGCSMTMLFDSWRVERSAAAPPPKIPSLRTMTFAASPGAQGKTLLLHIRGSRMGPGTARMRLAVGKAFKSLPIPSREGDFFLETPITLAAATDTRLELTAELEPSAGETALLDIDSIDASLKGCGKAKK